MFGHFGEVLSFKVYNVALDEHFKWWRKRISDNLLLIFNRKESEVITYFAYGSRNTIT